VRLRLAPGTDLAYAAGRLRDMETRRPVLASSSAAFQAGINTKAYVRWVREHEPFLKATFTDPELWSHLRTREYWSIRDGTTEPTELIHSELDRQTEWFGQMAAHIARLANRLNAATGRPTVVDTNVLLHYQDPKFVNWQDVTGENAVRLILPLRVIEELDKNKWSYQREEIRSRARGLLSSLWRVLAGSAGGPVALIDGVTIEVPLDDGPRQRSLNADEEILETCVDLKNVRQNVLLVTADTGMSLRATAVGVSVVQMPDIYLR
jgi:hypothetical protein